ncbi:restriction modification system DNA specificity subunit [Candidatus Mycoplasma haematolamae str. Purdue]|uniref:Restriction modification system DNA specificity subunit n=1 Tax=Mycoplasma haematolamae (strain Purdue) TaxID=1212765 RepID=I7BAR4_MYCHA|nr:restriction endonuclease subunit S [Candidatus Mycoplasma haematolamae]AFO52415.1 restriction modification system DNA specificity subunit [Candidatus Mycoplasma haematolamae str. Purdue]
MVERGKTPKVNHRDYWEGGHINFLISGELNWNYLEDSHSKVTQKAVEECSLKIQPPGTVLLSTNTIVRASILSAFCAHSTDSTAICVTQTPCVSEYLFYYFQLIFEGVKKTEQGSARHAIDKKKIRSLRIPFTSFAEQKEVVREIESRFALVSSIEKLGSDFELLKKVALKETFSLLEGS